MEGRRVDLEAKLTTRYSITACDKEEEAYSLNCYHCFHRQHLASSSRKRSRYFGSSCFSSSYNCRSSIASIKPTATAYSIATIK